MIKHSLFAGILFSTCIGFAYPNNLELENEIIKNAVIKVKDKLDQTEEIDYKTEKKIVQALSEKESFSDEEIAKSLGTLCKEQYSQHLTTEDRDKLNHVRQVMTSILKGYKVSGFSFRPTASVALVFGKQAGIFNICFKNSLGEYKYRRYLLNLSTVGLKYQYAFKLNLMFFVGTELNFFDSNKKIELGTGFEVNLRVPYNTMTNLEYTQKYLQIINPWTNEKKKISTLGYKHYTYRHYNDLSVSEREDYDNKTLEGWSLWYKLAGIPWTRDIALDLMYVPLADQPGAMIMISLPISFFVPWGLSIVTGGSLSPHR